MNKKYNKVKGNLGENLACEFLEKNGYKIINRNFICTYGEIDIITFYENEIIFIEVKTRYQNNYGTPIEAIDKFKKKHLYNTAKYYLYETNLLEAAIRFDVIEVFINDGNNYNIIHTKNIINDEPIKYERKYL